MDFNTGLLPRRLRRGDNFRIHQLYANADQPIMTESKKGTKNYYSNKSFSEDERPERPERQATTGSIASGSEMAESLRHDSSSKFVPIPDMYEELDDVREAMDAAGIETCGLIFAIDYTMSNKMQGRMCFNNRSLHDLQCGMNPYQEVICVLGDTLAPRIHGGLIPTFGFGDERTQDKSIFPLKEKYCEGFNDVLKTYEEVTPTIEMAGPTNFAPIIEEAINIVKKEKQFYILVIVADGQVTSKKATIDAIVQASKYPLSIVVIGVGDGPWKLMKKFDDELPEREFDNFQFVDFHGVMKDSQDPHGDLARNSLMLVPEQYRQVKKKGYLKAMQKQ